MIPQPTNEAPPRIWGKPATWDDRDDALLIGHLVRWRCPHCGAHLAKADVALPMFGNENVYICLNLCHLSAPQIREFTGLLQDAAAKSDDDDDATYW